MSIQPLSGGGKERGTFIIPSTTKAPDNIKSTDAKPVGDSIDMHTGSATSRVIPPMYGYGLEASAGGKNATIQLTKHSLGINVDAKA